MAMDLLDFDYSRIWPAQDKFPINEGTQDRKVKNLLIKDIEASKEYIIVTGFTSLSNLLEIFGFRDYPLLESLRIVIGYDPEERVGRRLPDYILTTEIKNYWVKQRVSIKHCTSVINLIEKINQGKYTFRVKNGLHAKLYVGDQAALLGSSNFSKKGIETQREANIRVEIGNGQTENRQYESIKQIANNYYDLSSAYNNDLIELLHKILKDADWDEAIARALIEVLGSRWMEEIPALYQSLINTELWPCQKIGIARAMKIIQDQGNVLIADPTGSGKTRFATALACTCFYWLWENGLKDRSSALIISPKQVMANWEKEHLYFKPYSKIDSMGRLSLGKKKASLKKEISNADILVIDEAHNYLRSSQRSRAIIPKGSTHVILSTATPINKKADDLLKLIELLDIDNLSDSDLKEYLELRRKRNRHFDKEHLDKLRGYINQFIVRRTKSELNKMIEREPEKYLNANKNKCRYPRTTEDSYKTGENESDKRTALKIRELANKLKGIQYLQTLTFPEYVITDDDKKFYLNQRLTSAPSLAAFVIHSTMRSSRCALAEYLYGSKVAQKMFSFHSEKSETGDIIASIKKCSAKLPNKQFPKEWLLPNYEWLMDKDKYQAVCEEEISTYEEIGSLIKNFSGRREETKADLILGLMEKYHKVLAFDSTLLTLDYLKKILKGKNKEVEILVATGKNRRDQERTKELFKLGSPNSIKAISLCSDAMSESINLPAGKAVVLLDMPSVMRIIEQRIGRIERMDSEHDEIYVYWPDDSEEFSLKGDERIINTLIVTENLIRTNVNAPKDIYLKYLKNIGISKDLFDKYLKKEYSTENFIKAYHAFSMNEGDWVGVRDSTQYLYGLMEGEDPLIDAKTYNLYQDVDASVNTALSFVESDRTWSFFAFKGSVSRSSKWLLIDDRNKVYTDFSDICIKLRSYLKDEKVVQRRWSEVDTQAEVQMVIKKLRRHESNLLPWKKKRALVVGETILRDIEKITPLANETRKIKINRLLGLFNTENDNEGILDFDHFAELWLAILVPALDQKRKMQKRKRNIITLKDLSSDDVELDEEKIDWLFENCRYSNTLDELIAACIIGIKRGNLET